jgi:hypothetical protein
MLPTPLQLSDNVFMPIEVAPGETDDPLFIKLLNSLLQGLLKASTPQEVWIIQIDNWFDHKWLRFSGIGTVDFKFPAFMNRYDGALDEFYQDNLTFPPFTPNRILSQLSFVRVGDQYAGAPLRKLPHSSEKQPSEANLHRRVDAFSRSACFVWYSAKTLANGKASVMVYGVAGDQAGAWFAAFDREQDWELHATKGTRRDDVQQLLNTVL